MEFEGLIMRVNDRYDPDWPDPEGFADGDYRMWNLARSWAEPNW